ncbi:MAG: septum formation protein Maf [Lachnospiraceae bacterium]|nr:septum formation protein Maf [Lachnospiraceae bacterium]
MTELILASASPRRKELMETAGLACTVIPAAGEEKCADLSPEETVRVLARAKAEEIWELVTHGARAGEFQKPIVIGADTVVSLEGRIFGKPRDRADAARMLGQLSGRTHEVYTGVAVLSPDEEILFAERTEVDVETLSAEEIEAYLATGEADDKAGAYGIQGRFGIHVTGIRGDYANVVGLPVSRLYRTLRDHDLL